jgi:transposase-like protein
MARIPDETREAIANDLRAGELTVKEVAEKHGVGHATVSRVAAKDGIIAARRDQTKRATEASKIDVAAEQARLAQLLIGDAFLLRDRAWEKQQVLVTYKDSHEIVERETDAGEFRNYYTSIGIIVDKVAVLTRDNSDGLAAVDAWLRSLGAGQTS